MTSGLREAGCIETGGTRFVEVWGGCWVTLGAGVPSYSRDVETMGHKEPLPVPRSSLEQIWCAAGHRNVLPAMLLPFPEVWG